MCNSIYVTFLRRQNYTNRKQINCCKGEGVGEGIHCNEAHWRGGKDLHHNGNSGYIIVYTYEIH